MEHEEIIKAFKKCVIYQEINPLLKYLDDDVELYDYYFDCHKERIDPVINYLEGQIFQNQEFERIITLPITYLGTLTKPILISKEGKIGTTQSFFTDDKQGICLFVKYKKYDSFDILPISFIFKKDEEMILKITINNRDVVNYVSSSLAEES